MTRPNSSTTPIPRGRVTHEWRSRWLVPLVPIALGVVVLIAAATAGHPASGLIWFAILAAVGGLSAFSQRLESARRGGRPLEDEREAMINTRAMSVVGTVLIIALTGAEDASALESEASSVSW
jgi:hypothetical protein